MAALTKEQIEQKRKLLAEKLNEMKAIHDELVEASALSLSEEDLEKVAGGRTQDKPQHQMTPEEFAQLHKRISDMLKRDYEEHIRKYGYKYMK